MTKKRVAVLMGGWSPEREVSLTSGHAVLKAMADSPDYDCFPVDVTRDIPKLMAALTPKPFVAFNALHGEGGEDGVIQGLLECLEIPYTHSGVMASAVGLDKEFVKHIARTHHILTPESRLISLDTLKKGPDFPYPYVIKPNAQGSSVGIYLIHNAADYKALNLHDWPYGDILIETYIPGRELTAGVMGDIPLPVTELRPKVQFYNYEAKYTDGTTDHHVPAPVPAAIADQARAIARHIHDLIGCRGVSRSDFRYDDTVPGQEKLYFLEINTHPGLTPLSLIPEMAAYAGYTFPQFIDWVIKAAHS